MPAALIPARLLAWSGIATPEPEPERGLGLRDADRPSLMDGCCSAAPFLTVDGKSSMIGRIEMWAEDGVLEMAACKVYLTEIDLWVETEVRLDGLERLAAHFGYALSSSERYHAIAMHLVTRQGVIVECAARDGWHVPIHRDGLHLVVDPGDIVRATIDLPDTVDPRRRDAMWTEERFVEVCERFGYRAHRLDPRDPGEVESLWPEDLFNGFNGTNAPTDNTGYGFDSVSVRLTDVGEPTGLPSRNT